MVVCRRSHLLLYLRRVGCLSFLLGIFSLTKIRRGQDGPDSQGTFSGVAGKTACCGPGRYRVYLVRNVETVLVRGVVRLDRGTRRA